MIPEEQTTSLVNVTDDLQFEFCDAEEIGFFWCVLFSDNEETEDFIQNSWN